MQYITQVLAAGAAHTASRNCARTCYLLPEFLKISRSLAGLQPPARGGRLVSSFRRSQKTIGPPCGPAVFYPLASLLVELTGIEPVTPCLQSRCSPS
jgi:hypothetical protein